MKVLTVKQVKEMLNCGTSTVYDLYNSGRLRGFRLNDSGGGIRIFAESIDELVARGSNEPKARKEEPAIIKLPERKPRPRATVSLKDLLLVASE